MARTQGDPGRSQGCAGLMAGLHNVTFLDEETKKLIIPFLDGGIIDNSEILVPSACKLQRSHCRGRTKKWLIH